MWYQLIRMIPQKMRMVEVMSRKTLLMLRNLWYFEDREPQVPRDIILAPETNGIFLAYSAKLNCQTRLYLLLQQYSITCVTMCTF